MRLKSEKTKGVELTTQAPQWDSFMLSWRAQKGVLCRSAYRRLFLRNFNPSGLLHATGFILGFLTTLFHSPTGTFNKYFKKNAYQYKKTLLQDLERIEINITFIISNHLNPHTQGAPANRCQNKMIKLTEHPTYVESYKGFAIFSIQDSDYPKEYATLRVIHSDIYGIQGIDAIKKEIDLQLSLTGKVVANYRGINIIRKWQNQEIIIRNGVEMVDNTFMYDMEGTSLNCLYETLDGIKGCIDNIADDRDDFYKKQFYSQWVSFCKKLNW